MAAPHGEHRRWTGATPLFEALVRAWGGVGFHKLRTAPKGSLPSVISPYGKAGMPMSKSSSQILVGAAAVASIGQSHLGTLFLYRPAILCWISPLSTIRSCITQLG